MPSFSVENENYYYYHEHYTANIDFDGKEIVCKCIQYTFIIIISFILLLSWYIGTTYLFTHNQSIYYDYFIYWFPNIMFSFLCSLWIIIILFLLRNSHQSDDTLHIMLSSPINHNIKPSQRNISKIKSMKTKCILFILFITSFIVIPLILIEVYSSDYILDLDSEIRSKHFENKWEWFQLFAFVIIPGLLPIICFIIWYCLFLQNKQQQQSMEMVLSIKKHKESNINNNDMNEMDNKYTDDMRQKLLIEDDADSIIDRQAKPFKQSILFLIIHFIVIFWYFLELRVWNESIIHSQNNSNNNSGYNLLGYYIQFLLFCIIFKWMMKYYGNIIDRIRSLRNNNQHYISIELLMEWYFSILYWIWFRWFIIFKINNTSSNNYQLQFIFIMFIHGLSEFIQTNLKISKKYFTISSICINWLFHHRMQNNFNFWLYSSFKDGSDKKQWINRICIDVMTRFYASTISAVISFILLIILGQKYFNQWFNEYYINNTENDDIYYKEALIWLSISISVEFIYYLISFYAILLTREYLVCEPMIKYISSMTKRHCLILLIIYFVQYSFFLFL